MEKHLLDLDGGDAMEECLRWAGKDCANEEEVPATDKE